MKPRINIIAAKANNNVIGKDNQLPWHLPADLKHFKDTTRGYPVIMGRKTFESLEKPLPGRHNIVISRQESLSYDNEDVTVVHSVLEALKATSEKDEIFIAGGSHIYQLALPFTDRIILTVIDAEPEGDTLFPEINMEHWKISNREKHKADEKNPYDYEFLILDRFKNE